MKENKCIAQQKIVVVLAILLISSLCLGSCGTPCASDTGRITVTDDLGREVRFSNVPTRVCALLGSFAEVWLLAGGTLSGAASDAWEDFDLTLDGVRNLGGVHSPSLEAIISSEPELVIASASTVSHLDMKDTLSAMGIPVLYFEVDSFLDYLSMLRRLTEITGREDLYQKNGLEIREGIERIKKRYSESSISEAQRKILLLRASSTAVKPKGSEGTVLGEMLADLGCINIADRADSALENLSIEAILRENPYHIFVVTMGKDEDAAMRSLESMIAENAAWESLDAVKNGRMHLMNKKQFNIKPYVRWAESYEILYEKLITP